MAVKITIDKVGGVLKSLKALERSQVLVGIPDTNADRKDGPASNAVIGYVQEFGNPELNIPARPFLVPGVDSVRPQVVALLRKGADAALSGSPAGVDRALNAAGMAGRNAAVEKITDGPFAPLKPATIRARWNRQKGRRGTAIPDSFTDSQKPLVSTGQLRAALTYVIRQKGR